MVKKKIEAAPEPKVLTQTEFERLERYRIESDLRKKEFEYLEAKNQHIIDRDLIINLMHKNLEVDRMKLEKERETLAIATQRTKQDREKTLKAVKDRLSLTDRFGYDPDTLEIVES